MRIASLAIVASLCGGGAASGQGLARPGDFPPAEAHVFPYSGVVPPCESQGALDWIASGFGSREAAPGGSGLAVAAFEEIHETGFRPHGASYIPRRHCAGVAVLSDGARRRVGYEIAEGQGFLGWGYGVRWCVVGFDRYHVYSPACKMTQP